MTAERVALDAPLPPYVQHEPGGLASYRDYPVFSHAWLRRRTLLFGVGFASFGALLGLAAFVQRGELAAALVVTLGFTLGGLTIASAGPLLATLVRHRGLPFIAERRLVVLSLVAGLFAGFAADSLASHAIETCLGSRLGDAPELPPESSAAAMIVNIVALLGIYGTFGGGLALRSYWNERRKLDEFARDREMEELRAKNEALDTHLGVLQAQIEPHFLFNSLASVRSLITTDPAAAAEAIDGLATYLRATIPRLRGSAVVSDLHEQLEICRGFLTLMRARMGRLTFTFDVEDEVRATPFPPLLLMSLVENAVVHGIEPKPGAGHIAVRARRAGGALLVRVEDDGVGLSPGVGTGVGLSNVRAHLHARYGAAARVTLTSDSASGTVATITIDQADVS